MPKPIYVPFNENTVHIYEAYVKVAKEIAARKHRELNGNTASNAIETDAT